MSNRNINAIKSDNFAHNKMRMPISLTNYKTLTFYPYGNRTIIVFTADNRVDASEKNAEKPRNYREKLSQLEDLIIS